MNDSRLIRTPNPNDNSDDHWIPLTDLMTGLMMVFMLVAVIFMVQAEAHRRDADNQRRDADRARSIAEKKTQEMRDVAEEYNSVRNRLYRDLDAEFASDLKRWKATLDPDLSIRFNEPEVLFDTGKADLKPQFTNILRNFFPRYVGILSGSRYRDNIEEIRIEGHTSTIWAAQLSAEESYFLNMELSQNRTRTTLKFVLLLPQVLDQRGWLIAHVTANGLSSSRPRFNPDGSENRDASQRVEFRVRTNAEARIGEILRKAQ